MGGLRLDSTEALRRGGDSGPLLAPGDPEKSLLIKAISYQDLRLKMPPKGKLSDEEIAAFASWVKMGGPGPGAAGASATVSLASSGPFDPDKARAFWCFRPPRESALPYVKQKDWPRSPIDYFILAKLEDKDLAPAPAADKYTWLRRVTMDLTGLPPTAHEIENFVTDASQDACAKVVDRLLASPHYGERWARHWLDLVRFAETNGHEFDEYGYFAIKDKVHVHDLHATILHLLGLDHTKLTYRFSGRDMRLTDVHGNIVKEILA